MGRFGGRAPAGLLITAAVAIVLAAGFDLGWQRTRDRVDRR